ncbi:MAG: hypothetical protein R3D67_14260 [Hyphomicrobiaceae bacterium]
MSDADAAANMSHNLALWSNGGHSIPPDEPVSLKMPTANPSPAQSR